MSQIQPYIEPAKNKLADYQRICESKRAIVIVRQIGDRFVVRRRWENQFGGGYSEFHLLPTGDTTFNHSGWFTIPIAEWTAINRRSLNQTRCSAIVPVHEWKQEYDGGALRYHDMPVALAGDSLTLLHVPFPREPLAVLVRSTRGQRFVMYLQHLRCPSDVPTTIPNGSSSAT